MVFSHHVREHGLTLVELLIAMSISGLLLAAVANTFITQRKSYALQEQITDMVQNARVTMAMMTREIRIAGYDPSGAGIDGITYDTSTICNTFMPGPRIRADLTGDGDTQDADEDVTYCYDATNFRLTRNTGSGHEPFAENVKTFTVEYLDSGGNPTATVGAIRQIRVSLTARTAKPDMDYHDPKDPTNQYRTYRLSSLIMPKNLAF